MKTQELRSSQEAVLTAVEMRECVMSPDVVDVCFVSMPFAEIYLPSVAPALLKACLTRAGIKSVIQHEYIYFAKYCGITYFNRTIFASADFQIGEMIFARAAHGKPLRSLEEYADWLINRRLAWAGASSEDLERGRWWLDNLPALQVKAAAFIEEAAARVMAHRPKIVALASMFQQINANIALVRRLKQEKDPPIILIGGSNCMGDAGVAFIEHIKETDYVFLGEADEVFADVCARLLKEGEIPPEELPFGVLSRCSKRPQSPVCRVTKDAESIPTPDFDDFIRTYKELFPDRETPRVMMEGSRGCWWGAKKPCAFCGLNGPTRSYREKTASHVADELAALSRRYPEAKICVFTDSILSYRQMKELPAALKAKRISLRIFTELKSNLTAADVRALSSAGFFQFQPGVESLQDDVLRLMNKGCRAIKQIETLKNCRVYHIMLTWNLLCGFVGEKDEYYAEMADLLPKLMHLSPPNHFIHIIYQRYGEYTENPERYGLELRTGTAYDFVFADRDFIERTAFQFEPAGEEPLRDYYDCTRKGPGYARVHAYAKQWLNERFNPQRLDMEDTAAGVFIYDMRTIARHAVYHLEGLQAEVYRACRAVRSEASLRKEFSGYGGEVQAALDYLTEENLMVHIGGEYLALAVDTDPWKKREMKGNGRAGDTDSDGPVPG